MKNELLKLLIIHLSGEVAKHKANLTVYFDNPAGIGEHPDIIEANCTFTAMASYSKKLYHRKRRR